MARVRSVVRDMGLTDRKRPQFLAVKLANETAAGDLVQTTLSGDNPTWNQPLVNGIQYNNAHLLQSYAFAGGGRRSVIVFNLDRSNALQVTFSGPNAPSGAATIKRLTAAAITASNESAENVAVATENVTSFDPAQPLTLAPFSMTVISSGQLGPLRIRAVKHGS